MREDRKSSVQLPPAEEQESIERVRAVLDEEARGCPDLADLWDGWSEELRRLAVGEPLSTDPVAPEWPEGHEPDAAPVTVPAVYVALFREEVEEHRNCHFGMSQIPAEDVGGESARTVWAFDQILSQLTTDDPGEDVEVKIPVHPDGSGELVSHLLNVHLVPSSLDRATDGLTAETAEDRRAGLAVTHAWLDVLEQLDALNAPTLGRRTTVPGVVPIPDVVRAQ